MNILRNVALSQVRTQYVLLNDVDFVPKPGLYQQLVDSFRSGKMHLSPDQVRDL